ncbi:DUF2637 domain-containing protein [Streptomyces sp. NPDC006460]|uniref:DUF2637 domain-containing protein n=1 Tax=Streptomyces sp. NPDC006460 TaxID=3154304 RepID=UPI0033A3BE13
MNSVQIRSAERALSVGTWLIVFGAMLYSVLTVTPLMAAHTADEWDWTAPILPLVVDAAVVIVVRLDSVLARLGGHGGRWPVVLRWMTGCMTLALNVADSALRKDLVGVAVHAVAPLLLIVTAETGLAYRKAITAALKGLEAERKAEQAERERVAVERREAAERRAREEREHAERLAREQRDHEARLAREQAEREDRARREERERAEAIEREARAERERVEQDRERECLAREQAEREREQRQRAREREAAQRIENERREREAAAARERAALLAAGPAVEKLPEDRARQIVTAAFGAGLPVRQAAELCGWSVGWVSTRYQELRDTTPARAFEGASS